MDSGRSTLSLTFSPTLFSPTPTSSPIPTPTHNKNTPFRKTTLSSGKTYTKVIVNSNFILFYDHRSLLQATEKIADKVQESPFCSVCVYVSFRMYKVCVQTDVFSVLWNQLYPYFRREWNEIDMHVLSHVSCWNWSLSLALDELSHFPIRVYIRKHLYLNRV